MTVPPPFTDLVRRLPSSVPFRAPEAIERARGRRFAARLGANESAFGPSPRAVAAMRESAASGQRYGDPESLALRQALGERLGAAPERIAVAGGIDELLGLFVRLFVAEGTPVVTSKGAYPTFAYHVTGFGGRLVPVPYKGDHEDLDGLLDAARRSGAPLVYLSNPDNPMGSWHGGDRVRAFAAALPPGTVLLLDEAYAEFAPEDALPDLDGLPRVVRLRTFSKAHGLAGLRIGYAVADPALVAALDKVRLHFGVGRVAQAGALASLDDPDHLAAVRAAVAAGRAAYVGLAAGLGLRALPSATNFVAIDMGGDGDRARAVLKALEDRNVFVRMPGVAPLDRCIRVTVGLPGERAVFAEALTRVVRG
ncbi:MAG: pyridoxal phosphate-dependent aminotransferase [Geminicoccaceae bacterium]|nr:pyridoxal phosphate-dependent aminotransferase [Geminicoccaceae bacterium]